MQQRHKEKHHGLSQETTPLFSQPEFSFLLYSFFSSNHTVPYLPPAHPVSTMVPMPAEARFRRPLTPSSPEEVQAQPFGREHSLEVQPPQELPQDTEEAIQVLLNVGTECLAPDQQEVFAQYLQGLEGQQRIDTIDRIRTLFEMAKKTFLAPAHDYARTGSQADLKRFETAYFDWFALIAPHLGTKGQWMQDAEMRTGLRNVTTLDKIWSSQEKLNRYATLEEVHQHGLEKDIELWQGTGGLPIHTATAAWAIERLVSSFQENIRGMIALGGEINQHQEHILGLDPSLMRVWLLFHDAMRTLTHNTFTHAVALPVFGKLLGLPDKLYKDYDVPEILAYKEEEPEKHNGGIPNLKIDKQDTDAVAFLRRGSDYIQDILRVLSKDPDRQGKFDSISMILFWVVDAYSKLDAPVYHTSLEPVVTEEFTTAMNLPSFPTVDKNLRKLRQKLYRSENKTGETAYLSTYQTDPDTRERQRITQRAFVTQVRKALKGQYETNTFHYGREPDKTPDIFVSRLRYRNDQGGTGFGSMSRYYLSQERLAWSCFDFMQDALEIDREDIWKFFMEVNEMSHQLIDANGQFLPRWISGREPLSSMQWTRNQTLEKYKEKLESIRKKIPLPPKRSLLFTIEKARNQHLIEVKKALAQEEQAKREAEHTKRLALLLSQPTESGGPMYLQHPRPFSHGEVGPLESPSIH